MEVVVVVVVVAAVTGAGRGGFCFEFLLRWRRRFLIFEEREELVGGW